MKRMKSTGEMTEPQVTPAYVQLKNKSFNFLSFI